MIPCSASTIFQLISRAILKSTGNYAVALSGSVDVFENAAHPGVVADVVVWHTRAAKGTKDIDDDAEALHIVCKMLVQQLDVWHGVRADVLVGIVVIHHYDVPAHLTVDQHGSPQLGEDSMHVGIYRRQVAGEAGRDGAGTRINIGQQVVRAYVERDGADLAPVNLQVGDGGGKLRANIREFAQVGIGATTIDERAARLTWTPQVRQVFDAMLGKVAHKIIRVPVTEIEVGLEAEGQRITEGKVTRFGTNQCKTLAIRSGECNGGRDYKQ